MTNNNKENTSPNTSFNASEKSPLHEVDQLLLAMKDLESILTSDLSREEKFKKFKAHCQSILPHADTTNAEDLFEGFHTWFNLKENQRAIYPLGKDRPGTFAMMKLNDNGEAHQELIVLKLGLFRALQDSLLNAQGRALGYTITPFNMAAITPLAEVDFNHDIKPQHDKLNSQMDASFSLSNPDAIDYKITKTQHAKAKSELEITNLSINSAQLTGNKADIIASATPFKKSEQINLDDLTAEELVELTCFIFQFQIRDFSRDGLIISRHKNGQLELNIVDGEDNFMLEDTAQLVSAGLIANFQAQILDEIKTKFNKTISADALNNIRAKLNIDNTKSEYVFIDYDDSLKPSNTSLNTIHTTYMEGIKVSKACLLDASISQQESLEMTSWSEDASKSFNPFSPSKFGTTSSQDQSPAGSDWLSPSKSSSQDEPLLSDAPLLPFEFGARDTSSFFNFGGAGSTDTSPQKPLAKSCSEESASRSSLDGLPHKLFELDLSQNTESNSSRKRKSSDSASEEQSNKKSKLSHNIDITIKDSIKKNFYQRKTHIISTLETLANCNDNISLIDLLFALDPIFEKHYQQYVDAQEQANKAANTEQDKSETLSSGNQYSYPNTTARNLDQKLSFSKLTGTGEIYLYTGAPKQLSPFTSLIISELLPNFDHQAKPLLEAELEKMYQWLPQKMDDACKRKRLIEELNGIVKVAEYFLQSNRKLPFTLPKNLGKSPTARAQHLFEHISILTTVSNSMKIGHRFASPTDCFFNSPATNQTKPNNGGPPLPKLSMFKIK